MVKSNTYDAIVVGSGMSGGWAAKELSENGLQTLILERGRHVTHIKDYPTTNKAPWEYEFRQRISEETGKDYKVQKELYAFSEATKHFFVKDSDEPYTHDESKPFKWRRGYQTGGKSILWARQSYRFSDIDFKANEKDGYGSEWPITYEEIAPWYEYVEKYVGISGKKEGLRQLPDSHFLPPMKMNCVEDYFRESVAQNFDGRVVTVGRTTNLSVHHNGRGPCQYRNMCETGCPYNGYFNSAAVTIPAALNTGNATLKNNSIVHSVIYDAKTGKASGVRVIDAETMETTEYYAKVIFMCASTIASTRILLNSKSESFPDGLANSSGVMGHYLMDHFISGVTSSVEGYEDSYYDGHRPTGIYVPRFVNIESQDKDYLRGFGFQGKAFRDGWKRGYKTEGIGASFKDDLSKPGPWKMFLAGFGEILPYYDNHMKLDEENKDKWGIPRVHFSCELKENEKKMDEAILNSAAEMMDAAGFKDITYRTREEYFFGDGIHEMGTARMGKDRKNSVVNKWNACHDVPNLFITDGSFMASSGCQNPSLTYMAFTARAANYVVEKMKRKEF